MYIYVILFSAKILLFLFHILLDAQLYSVTKTSIKAIFYAEVLGILFNYLQQPTSRISKKLFFTIYLICGLGHIRLKIGPLDLHHPYKYYKKEIASGQRFFLEPCLAVLFTSAIVLIWQLWRTRTFLVSCQIMTNETKLLQIVLESSLWLSLFSNLGTSLRCFIQVPT